MKHNSLYFKCDQVKNDIMMLTDQTKAVIVVFLDLSSAFDTIDHDVLFSQLKNCLVCQVMCFTGLVVT